MMTAATALPLLGLRITAGPVELRGFTDDLIGHLADLAINGIRDPDSMPFGVPWSIAPAEEMPREHGSVPLGAARQLVRRQVGHGSDRVFDGELFGSQGFGARDFLITRIGETGSWLGRHSRAAASAPQCDGWDTPRLAPLLAGPLGIMPWVRQRHSEIDPAFGQSPAEAFDAYLTSERESRNLTEDNSAPGHHPSPNEVAGRRRGVRDPGRERTSESV
jgi:hypothetical protein